jgi:hypothetical protein
MSEDAFNPPERLAVRLAGKSKAKPRDSQKCKYCDQPADKSLLFSDGRAHVPVCRAHESNGREELRKHGEGVEDVVGISPDPIFRMARTEATADSNFGLRARGREPSAVTEAPPLYPGWTSPGPGRPLRYKRIGLPRHDPPTTAVGTIGIGPESILQMLATDWKTFRMQRVHDNRLSVRIDGTRFTVYSRRG